VRRSRRGLAIGLALILLALCAWLLIGRANQRPPAITAAALTPAPTPADARTVAVLRLAVTSDAAGGVTGVTMSDGQVLPGYGPNVLHRPGAWTVSLNSATGEALRFGVLDPREVRVEGGSGDIPHTGSFLTAVEFELIVPLSDALGTDLAITDLRLFDQAGNLIFAASLRGGEVTPIPLQRTPAGAAG
jgi:hypothetical protein